VRHRVKGVLKWCDASSVMNLLAKLAKQPSRSCDECSTEYCIECFYDCGGDSCADCEKTLCEQCIHNGQNRLISYCEGCSNDFCKGCRNVTVCSLCHDPMCDKWVTFKQLPGLHGKNLVCEECVIPRQCDGCDKKYCESEVVEKCDICKKTLCEECAEVKQCSTALAPRNFVSYVARSMRFLAATKHTARGV
jgi:hypothetical protein